jgi:hypothetical protein
MGYDTLAIPDREIAVNSSPDGGLPRLRKLYLSNVSVQGILVFAASALAVIAFWAVLPSQYRGYEGKDYMALDYTTFYEPPARNLLSGKGLVLADGSPAVRYPPGYSLALALVFGTSSLSGIPEELLYSALVLLCVGSTAVFVFFLALRAWGQRSAFVVVSLWMTFPLMLWLTKEPRSEIIFMPPMYGALLLLLGKGRVENAPGAPKNLRLRYFVAGALIGCATLVRPIAIGLGVVMAILLWSMLKRTSRLALVAMLLVGNLAVVLPWEVWVYARTGQLVILGTGGNAAIINGLTFGVDTKGYRSGIAVPSDVAALMEDIYRQYPVDDGSQTLEGAFSIMGKALLERPVTVAKLVGIKAARSWYGTDSGRLELPVFLIQVVYVGAMVVAGVFAWMRRGKSRELAAVTAGVVAYFWLMSILGPSFSRYMVPVMGLGFVMIPALWHRPRPECTVEDMDRQVGSQHPDAHPGIIQEPHT